MNITLTTSGGGKINQRLNKKKGTKKMKELNIINGKMSTLQFAELTGTKHYHVLAKARKLLNDLGIDCNKFSIQYKDSSGKSNVMLELDKDLSLTLAGQYEPKIAYHVAQSFNAVPQLPDFNNPAAAARAWADKHEALQLEQQKTAELSTALDKEFGYCSILRAARFLGVSEKVFNWRPLKAESLRIGYPAKKAPSPRYGYQNLYPLQAFKTCYPDYDFSDLTPDSTNLTPLTF